MEPVRLTSPEGVEYRDLNGNGQMDPFEDPRRPVDERVDDLLGRMSLEEKAGLMFQTVIEAGTDGSLIEAAGAISKSPTSVVVKDKHLTHFNVHVLEDARMAARWHNALQALAEQTPHGIPVTISTDPRHAFIENAGVSFTAKAFSQWPEPLGLAALRDVDAVRRFADIARQEYAAVGHPGRAAPDARPGHRAAVGAPGGHLRAGPRPRHRAGRGLPQGVPAGRAGTGQRGLHEQALPRRRPAEGRRGRALPLRPRAGLPRRAVRRPPQAVPADHRGRHRRDHAVLRHAGRARDRRREDRGGRLRLQPPGRHRAAARAARLRRGGRHRLGARQRQPRRRPGAAGARLGRRAPRPARSDGAHPRTPARTSSAARSASTSCSTWSSRAGSARSASTSRPGGCWP